MDTREHPVPPTTDRLGAVLRRLRSAQAMTTAELGERSRLPVARIEQLELGRLDPSMDELLALGQGLGVAVSSMVRMAELGWGENETREREQGA